MIRKALTTSAATRTKASAKYEIIIEVYAAKPGWLRGPTRAGTSVANPDATVAMLHGKPVLRREASDENHTLIEGADARKLMTSPWWLGPAPEN